MVALGVVKIWHWTLFIRFPEWYIVYEIKLYAGETAKTSNIRIWWTDKRGALWLILRNESRSLLGIRRIFQIIGRTKNTNGRLFSTSKGIGTSVRQVLERCSKRRRTGRSIFWLPAMPIRGRWCWTLPRRMMMLFVKYFVTRLMNPAILRDGWRRFKRCVRRFEFDTTTEAGAIIIKTQMPTALICCWGTRTNITFGNLEKIQVKRLRKIVRKRYKHREKSKFRCRIEHGFGFMTSCMHGIVLRSIGVGWLRATFVWPILFTTLVGAQFWNVKMRT